MSWWAPYSDGDGAIGPETSVTKCELVGTLCQPEEGRLSGGQNRKGLTNNRRADSVECL